MELTTKEINELLDAMELPKTGNKEQKLQRVLENSYIETQDASEVQPYEIRMWAGKIPVYVCKICCRQYNDLDRLLKHIAGHGERSKL